MTQKTSAELVQNLAPTSTYHTNFGALFQGKFEQVIRPVHLDCLAGRVNLIFTSPPFVLNRKKRYDNEQGEEYVRWLSSYAEVFRELLSENGSLVIELGNAWEPGQPTMLTLPLEALLEMKKSGGFYLCQQFVAQNPARLPSPVQWVNVKRTRVTDSFTHIWWLSKTPNPKADNRKVLRPYSDAMKRLLERQRYNHGKRPGEGYIGEKSFLKNNNGSIPHNAIVVNSDEEAKGLSEEDLLWDQVESIVSWLYGSSSMMEISNTSSTDPYLRYCRAENIPLHPARYEYYDPQILHKLLD